MRDKKENQKEYIKNKTPEYQNNQRKSINVGENLNE